MSAVAAPTTRIVRVLRLSRLVLHTLVGAITIACVFPHVKRHTQQRLIRRWSKRTLNILGVRLRVDGLSEFAPGTVIVANHVSWIDISLLNAVKPMCFVAKSEIRRWPMIGWMSAQAGTLFIERSRKRDTMRINNKIQAALGALEVVAVFPEGATTDGTHVRPFHASLLQPAIDAQARLVVLGIRYLHADGRINTDAAYVDEMTLWQSIQRILLHKELRAELIELGEIPIGGRSRREVAREAEARVRAVVLNGNSPETPDGLPSELP